MFRPQTPFGRRRFEMEQLQHTLRAPVGRCSQWADVSMIVLFLPNFGIVRSIQLQEQGVRISSHANRPGRFVELEKSGN